MDRGTTSAGKSAANRQGWKQNPEAVRENILAVALKEFSRSGLSGARMNEIAEKTKTSKRMIYYYFGDKVGLYQQVLEQAYREVRSGEEELQLDHLDPREALRQLVEFTFDHHNRNPDFIRLVMIENIHHGEYLRHLEEIKKLNRSAISSIEDVYQRGVAEGHFREGLSPLAIHWQISAFSFFNVSNRESFSLIFGGELFSDEGQAALRSQIAHSVLVFVSKP